MELHSGSSALSHPRPSHSTSKKNLWRRKCVSRGIFRTVEERVEEGFAPFNHYFVCNTAAESLCDLSAVILH